MMDTHPLLTAATSAELVPTRQNANGCPGVSELAVRYFRDSHIAMLEEIALWAKETHLAKS